LAVPHEKALRIRDDVEFFQVLRAQLTKRESPELWRDEQLEHAIRQIVSRAVGPGGVLGIFEAAGLKKPDISVLSEEFLAEVRGMRHKNLAVEMLERLIAGEIRARRKRNVVQARRFSEMLEAALLRYRNRVIEAA